MRHLLCGLAILLLAVTGAKADPVIDRDFKIAGIALIASSIFDAETTVQAIKSGRAHEANPIAAPFVGNGDRLGTYGYALLTDAVALGVTYELKRRGFKGWKVFPYGLAVAHVFAGGSNLRFVF